MESILLNCLPRPRVGVLHVPQVISSFDNMQDLIEIDLLAFINCTPMGLSPLISISKCNSVVVHSYENEAIGRPPLKYAHILFKLCLRFSLFIDRNHRPKCLPGRLCSGLSNFLYNISSIKQRSNCSLLIHQSFCPRLV